MSTNSLLISVQEAARRLGIGRDRCYRWVRCRILPSAKDGHRYYVPARAVDNLVDRIARGEWNPPA